jgi:flagellar motor switch protein FliM
VADKDDQSLDDDWAAALAEQSSGQAKVASAEGGEASLADEWGAALAEQGGSNNTSDMAAEWATMID